VLGLLVLVLPLLLPFELESGAEGIEPVASMFVSDFVADEPDGPDEQLCCGVSNRLLARFNIGLFVIWSPSFLVMRRGVVRGDGM